MRSDPHKILQGDCFILNWLRNRNPVNLPGISESVHNPAFNSVEFDGIRMRAGLNTLNELNEALAA